MVFNKKGVDEMKKRVISIFMTIILISVLLGGCSSKTKVGTEQSIKTIKFATFYSDKDQGGIYKDIARDFEKTNKEIKVEVVTDYGNEDKIKEAYSNKGNIDIIGIKRNQFMEYAKSGVISDISNMIDTNQYDKKLYKISLAYGNYNGKNYGIGDLPMSMEWFYNPKIFTNNHLTVPTNLKQLLLTAKKLKAKKLIPVGIGAIDGWTISTLFGMITAQTTGISEFTNNYGGDMTAFKKISNISKAFGVFSKLSGNAILTNSEEINYKQSVQDFINGKTAILPTGSWATELIDTTKSSDFNYSVLDNLELTENPISQNSVTCGEVLTIPNNSKNSKEAEAFLKYLYSDEVQKKFVEKGYISSLISANSSENETKKLILKHIAAANDNSIMLMDNLESSMLESMTMVLKDVLQGRVKPNDAWDRTLKFTFQR